MARHGPGHLRAFDYVGVYRYFLTFCTDSRRRAFASAEAVDLVMQQIEHAALEEQFAIVAYCFMPDHLHLLIEGRAKCSNALRFVTCAKQASGYYYQKRFAHRLWQHYGFERVLRSDEATLGVARYILENPVRAGLVTRVDDYPFVGSRAYALHDILAAVPQKPSG